MKNKKILALILILLISFGIILRVFSLNKDFEAEETDFVSAGIALKNTGHPVFYNSELYPKMNFLLHPPMYIYLLSIIFKFYTNEVSARLLNMIFSIFTAIFIFFFCLSVIKKQDGLWIGIISSTFFLINYYVLSLSLLIDIDIISSFFVFGFVFLIMRYIQTKKNLFSFLAILFLIFSIANRFPIAILTYFFIGLYLLTSKNLKRHFKSYFYIGFFSFFIFISLWFIYSTFIEPGTFFSFIMHNAKLGTEQLSNPAVYIGSFILNISQIIRLFTFPVVILMIWSFFYSLKNKSEWKKIILLYIIPILTIFVLVPRPAFGYPRYFMTIFPGVSILIGAMLYEKLNKINFNNKKKIIFLISLLASFLILIYLNPQATIYSGNGLIKATNLIDFLFNLFGSIPIFIPLLYKKDREKIILIVLIALILSYSIFFDIKFFLNNPSAKEVGEYLKEKTIKEEIILAPKAVAYYADRRFHINANNKPRIESSYQYLIKYITKSYENPKMDDEFFWPGGVFGGLYPPIPSQEELDKASYAVLYHPIEGRGYEKKIGEFYIYNLR
ncbi:MAG: hypothetical protein AABX30_01430 [Nanoarchaeota archaeon]